MLSGHGFECPSKARQNVNISSRPHFGRTLGGAALFFAQALSATTPARAADGADGPNGNGAGSPVITNQTPLVGGVGGDGSDGGFGGRGGIGVLVTGGDPSQNLSTISGGAGGHGGDGFAGGAGGVGGAGAYFAASGVTFMSSGELTGGAGGRGGGADSFGVGVGGAGGAGVFFAASSVTFTNTGAVSGGAGARAGGSFGTDIGFGGVGGAGALFSASGATFTNSGVVSGGAGGAGGGRHGGAGGVGGAGAFFSASGATFANSGVVTGGSGGDGLDNLVLFGGGGAGGAGASFTASGATFTNSGEVSGGAGGVGRFGIGAGGVGVTGAGLTIINSGTISGGLSGDGTTRASSIIFSGGVNVLEIRAGSQIVGDVVGTGYDAFRLGGNVDGSFDVSAVGSQYKGFAEFQKTGGGAWTLTDSSNAAAPWRIDGGTLIVNGSIAESSSVTVNSGASFRGEGTVGNVLVAGGGVFAPGAIEAPGTMTVAGDLTFRPGAHYVAHIAGTQASRADVSGVARLDGTLVASIAPGSVWQRSYDLLHADGGMASTRFAGSSVDGVLPNFRENLRYGANDVFLELTAALAFGAALPGNAQSVARAIDGHFNAGGALPGNFSTLYALTGGNLSGTLSSISGEAVTGGQQTAFGSTRQFIAAMLDPLAPGRGDPARSNGPALSLAPEQTPLRENVGHAYASALKDTAKAAADEGRWTTWASSFGGYDRLSGAPSGSGSHALSTNGFGVAAGLDYHLTRDTLFGAALAGGGTSWSVSQGLGAGRSDALHAGLYASTRQGPAYLSGAFAFANHWMSTERAAAFGDLLTARFDAQTYGGRIESGYRLETPLGGLAPYVAAQGLAFRSSGFHENDMSGGGFGLAYKGHTASDIRAELGARFDHVVALTPAAALALRSRFAFAHDWVSDPRFSAMFLAIPGFGFTVEGARPVKNAALVSGGAELRFIDGAAVGARFDGEFAPRSAASYAGTVSLRYDW